MKKILLQLSLAVASCVPTVSAQLTAPAAFTEAPAQVFPLLDRNTRLDMVDYFSNGQSTPSQNKLNGTSVITALTPESVNVKLTDSSFAQLVVLPAGKDSVIMIISTVATPGLDSAVSFYDRKWNRLPTASYFVKPGWKDWLAPGGKMEDVSMQTPFMLASYEYDPAASTLTLKNNLPSFLDPEIYGMISASLRQKLTYNWNGKRFRPVEK